MLRVIACVALLASACAVDPPPPTMTTRTVVKVVKVETAKGCPSGDQIKDAAIAASRATYFKAPRIYRSGSGACPCRDDTYEKDGSKLKCGDQSAEAKTGWVMSLDAWGFVRAVPHGECGS
jgi:hypothetical protein